MRTIGKVLAGMVVSRDSSLIRPCIKEVIFVVSVAPLLRRVVRIFRNRIFGSGAVLDAVFISCYVRVEMGDLVAFPVCAFVF